MYKNLQAVMAKENITQREIAEYLGIHENSMGNKVSGKTPFTIEEVFKMKERFFPQYDIQFLLKAFSKSA